jgi:hypothetical protein
MEALQMKTKQTPAEFFYEQAGYSYDPKTETEDEGRRKCAAALAHAEAEAAARGYSFQWEEDQHTDSSEFDDSPEVWSLWACLMRDEEGAILASLGGIDFGAGGEPWNDPYRRVVQAELACEMIDE